MTVVALIALAVLAGSACSAPQARIIGGTPTTIDKYPSMLAIENYSIWTGVWAQACGANILTTRFVFSAAHCFQGLVYDIRNRRFRAGSTYRNIGGMISNAVETFHHPTWGTLGFDGDISVIRIETPWIYSPVIQPATIVSQGWTIPDDTPVVYIGWGFTQEFPGIESPVLLETTVFTINNELCAYRYINRPNWPSVVTENMICAGILDVGGKDACNGDSGGPMYLGNVIVGLVSWGRCAHDYYPGVSIAVSPYSDWIIETVAVNS